MTAFPQNLFEFAYSTVAVCQPVRQTMQTGLYPHRSASMGFYPIMRWVGQAGCHERNECRDEETAANSRLEWRDRSPVDADQ